MNPTEPLALPDAGGFGLIDKLGVKRALHGLMVVLGRYAPVTIYDGFGLVLEVLGRRSGREFNVGSPWQMFDAGEASADRKITVNLHSHLLRSLRCTDKITVSGLDFPFDVGEGDKVWLELTITNYAVESATVKHGSPAANGWAEYPEPVRFEGAAGARQQTRAFVPLAYVIATEDEQPYDPPGIIVGTGSNSLTVVNLVRTHLLVAETGYGGDTVLYPMPWFGALIHG